jgi:hypothetical protein
MTRLLSFVALTGLVLGACHSNPAEPSVPDSAAPPAAAPRGPETHVIVEADHRRAVSLAIGDVLVLPEDPAFVWQATFEDPTLFVPVAPEAGVATTRYRAAKTGGTHLVVDGDPKCLHQDGGCGTSVRQWRIAAFVR